MAAAAPGALLGLALAITSRRETPSLKVFTTSSLSPCMHGPWSSWSSAEIVEGCDGDN
jgi:hypothetical protein